MTAVKSGKIAETVARYADMFSAGKLARAGFDAMDIEPTRVYTLDDARQFLAAEGLDVDAIAPLVAGKFAGAFIRAVKPWPKSCCAPACCS
jgi:arsenite methyltransferase